MSADAAPDAAPDAGIDAAICALTDGASLRTWSLIVTIFGDMARSPGAEVPGPVLSALARRIGVKHAALRVALHRLRKDGWIAARRDGRLSRYALTEAGRVESERATSRIYATSSPDPGRWHVVVAGPVEPARRLALDSALAASGYLTLGPGAWLGPGSVPTAADPALVYLEGAAPVMPGWLRESLMPPALAEAYTRFDRALAGVDAALTRARAPLTPLDRAAIRILVVHGWRRLVLRHPELPDAFFPADWPGRRARARVHRLLDRLGRLSVEDLADGTLA